MNVKKIGLSIALASIPTCFLGLLIWQMAYTPKSSNTSTKCTVTFMDGDEELKNVEVTQGERCPYFSPSLQDGVLKLTGWKKNQEDIENFNFNNPITQNMTLYANYGAMLNYDFMIENTGGMPAMMQTGTLFETILAKGDLANTTSSKFICNVDLNRLESTENLGSNILLYDDLSIAAETLVQPTDLEIWIGNTKLVENVDYKYETDATYSKKVTWIKPITKCEKIMTIASTFNGEWNDIKSKNHDALIQILNPFED